MQTSATRERQQGDERTAVQARLLRLTGALARELERDWLRHDWLALQLLSAELERALLCFAPEGASAYEARVAARARWVLRRALRRCG